MATCFCNRICEAGNCRTLKVHVVRSSVEHQPCNCDSQWRDTNMWQKMIWISHLICSVTIGLKDMKIYNSVLEDGNSGLALFLLNYWSHHNLTPIKPLCNQKPVQRLAWRCNDCFTQRSRHMIYYSTTLFSQFKNSDPSRGDGFFHIGCVIGKFETMSSLIHTFQVFAFHSARGSSALFSASSILPRRFMWT